MKFEWDEKKSKENILKHSVSFAEAKELFDDPFHTSVLDIRFDYLEERWIAIGSTTQGKIIVIGFAYLVENIEERIRIITARKATKKEREQYEEVKKRERFRA